MLIFSHGIDYKKKKWFIPPTRKGEWQMWHPQFGKRNPGLPEKYHKGKGKILYEKTVRRTESDSGKKQMHSSDCSAGTLIKLTQPWQLLNSQSNRAFNQAFQQSQEQEIGGNAEK